MQPSSPFLDPRHLGQLMLMQSMVGSLPDEQSISNFVCRGLADLPGVKSAEWLREEVQTADSAKTLLLPIDIDGSPPRQLVLHLSDAALFSPYTEYLKNFCFMLTVILAERYQRELNEQHQANLEQRVAERTLELEKEIAERHRAEHALRDSIQLFRSTFENTAIGICLTDIHGVLRLVNPAMAAILGYEAEELQGRKGNDFTHPEDLERSAQHISMLLAGERQFASLELRYLHRTGHTVWTRVGIMLMRNHNNEPQYFITHIEDITEKRRNEQEKRQLEEQLRQALKMEAIGTLAGGIAHDFNNLLSIILGFGEIAMLDLEEKHPAARCIGEILRAGNRAKELVRQILAYSRKEPQQLTPIEPHIPVRETLRLFRVSIPDNITIRTEIDQNCGHVLADAGQIHQILMNLATNARQAMEEGDGGEIRIELQRTDWQHITPIAQRNRLPRGEYIRLSVRDNGCGINPRDLDRIFDPYFTTKGVGKGSGLGLAVVAGAVKSHHGLITVESSPGTGSAFHVYLPRLTHARARNHEAESPLPTGRERVLVIDDEEHIVEVMRKRLELLGYRTSGASSGQAALKLFRLAPESFDLVISDQTMPGLTGDRLAVKLRDIRPSLPIILCSGNTSRINAETAAAMKIDAFLLKPVDQRELAETVRKVLDDRVII